MTLLTLPEFLSRLRLFLDGSSDFSVIRDWVYSFYEGEESFGLDEALEEIFPVLLSYLQYDEAEKDPNRDIRLRRVYKLLCSASSSFAERTVFGLEYDEIHELTKKLRDKLITQETYQRKMGMLSPAPYDQSLLANWANAHRDKNEPAFETLPDNYM